MRRERWAMGDGRWAMGDDRIVFADELGRVAITYLGENATPVRVGDDALEWWGVTARS